MKEIFVINGNASESSANQELIANFAALKKGFFKLSTFPDLKSLPHFNPQLSTHNTPKKVLALDNILKLLMEF